MLWWCGSGIMVPNALFECIYCRFKHKQVEQHRSQGPFVYTETAATNFPKIRLSPKTIFGYSRSFPNPRTTQNHSQKNVLLALKWYTWDIGLEPSLRIIQISVNIVLVSSEGQADLSILKIHLECKWIRFFCLTKNWTTLKYTARLKSFGVSRCLWYFWLLAQ